MHQGARYFGEPLGVGEFQGIGGATSRGHHEPQRFLSLLASGVGVDVRTLEPVGSRSSFSGEGEGSEVNGTSYSISRATAVFPGFVKAHEVLFSRSSLVVSVRVHFSRPLQVHCTLQGGGDDDGASVVYLFLFAKQNPFVAMFW